MAVTREEAGPECKYFKRIKHNLITQHLIKELYE